jgi:uncharacterized protein
VKNYPSPFKPAWWLNNAHLQTLYPSLCRQPPRIKTKRERFQTADEDFIDIDFFGEEEWPLVIILHGLTGSSDSSYVKGLQETLFQQKLRSAALNFRGCSGEPNNTALWYHSGETSDLNAIYQILRHKQPDIPIAVVGFSLGGNVLLKWLGEQGENLDVFAAVAVSAPLLLGICATRLDKGFSKLYRNQLIRELKSGLYNKYHHLMQINLPEEAKKLADLGDVSQAVSFWQYDEMVVAPLYGFQNAADYYNQNSGRRYMQNIQTPTLLIQALDDPFMTPEVIPPAAEFSGMIELEITAGGGHVGFIYGTNPFKPKYWLDQRIPEFINRKLANSSK